MMLVCITLNGSEGARKNMLCWLAAGAGKYDQNSFKKNCQIQCDRTILDIKEIVLEFAVSIGNRGAIWKINLRPPGEPGFYNMPHVVKRNNLAKLLYEFRPFRPWADER